MHVQTGPLSDADTEDVVIQLHKIEVTSITSELIKPSFLIC
jgi:hypothetical protein